MAQSRVGGKSEASLVCIDESTAIFSVIDRREANHDSTLAAATAQTRRDRLWAAARTHSESNSELSMMPQYEIIDGVRRAKAMQLAGHLTIRARLYAKGAAKLVQEFDVPIERLRSPHKNAIKRVTRSDLARWRRVVEGAKLNPLPFPPIQLIAGSRGVRVEEISFDDGDIA